MTTVSANPQHIVDDLDLEKFFEEVQVSHDLSEGVAFSPAQTRVIYLSSDIILGIYRALKEETGPAWSLILKNCGRLWGRKVAKNLENEMQVQVGMAPHALTAEKYVQLLEAYFPAHGWGRLSVDLSDAPQHGLIRFTMRNSLFVDVLDEETVPVDGMISGILQGFFHSLVEHPLDCIEVGCARQGFDHCSFILTHEDRLADVEDEVEAGKSPEDIIESLKH